MGKPTGFLEYDRKNEGHRSIEDRVKDYNEMMLPLTPKDLQEQAARCMDCGIPFCHGYGCPLQNKIPDFNEFIYQDRWEEACKILHSTNNFPEITGRVCPAPCEAACTLGLHDNPVTIRHIEYQIVEKGFTHGWIKPQVAQTKTGKKIAVVGAGPAGMAAAQQLARAGNDVVLFDKEQRIGGLVRYGIPNFKLDKNILDRRLAQMEAEGVEFKGGVNVGVDITVAQLKEDFDAVCLSMGAGVARDLNVTGREFSGVHFALELLAQQNKVVSGEISEAADLISAKDKVVIVIGGGDTGSDCVGTANRHGAKEVYQFEIMPEPAEQRPSSTPWPMWPAIKRTSTSQKEGCTRKWCITTKELIGENGKVTKLKGAQVQWSKDDSGRWQMSEVSGSEFEVQADLVLLAMGFVHVDQDGVVKDFAVELDQRGNVVVNDDFQTNVEGVFAAGDTVLGASLVVRGIATGRKMAEAVDKWLQAK